MNWLNCGTKTMQQDNSMPTTTLEQEVKMYDRKANRDQMERRKEMLELVNDELERQGYALPLAVKKHVSSNSWAWAKPRRANTIRQAGSRG